jgi:hypothetical protein
VDGRVFFRGDSKFLLQLDNYAIALVVEGVQSRLRSCTYPLTRQGFKDVVGEFGKPNPPAPFPRREGGAGKPLSLLGEGLGRGQTPQLINQQHP